MVNRPIFYLNISLLYFTQNILKTRVMSISMNAQMIKNKQQRHQNTRFDKFERRSRMERKNMQDLLTCFEQFASNLEVSFMELGQKLSSFKRKITDIKQSLTVDHIKKKPKNKMFKGIPKPKKRVLKNQPVPSAIKADQEDITKEQIIEAFMDMNTLDMDENNLDNKIVDLTGTLSQTLDFDINEWFNQETQAVSKHISFKQFFELQSNRIKKSDPLASQADIKKFAQDKWSKMTQLQRSSFIQNEKKRISATSKNSNKKSLQKNKELELQANRFGKFLDRKIHKVVFSGSENVVKNQFNLTTQNSQTKITASQLLNVLQTDTRNKQLNKETKLNRIFQNFQF